MNKILLIIIGIVLIAGGVSAYKNLGGDSASSASHGDLLVLDVQIPCPGHAYLIQNALNSLNGVNKVDYTPISMFKVYYDSSKISEEEILQLNIFEEYPARIK